MGRNMQGEPLPVYLRLYFDEAIKYKNLNAGFDLGWVKTNPHKNYVRDYAIYLAVKERRLHAGHGKH